MARNHGFLTDGDREKLTGTQDLESHSNVPAWKQRVRESIRGAYDDFQLLQESPYWTDEDMARVWRESHNGYFLSPLSGTAVDTGVEATTAQTKIYGDSVNEFAENLRDLDVDSSWQDAENVEKEVQRMFVTNTIAVIRDVLHLVGVTNEEVTKEFIEDVWPEKNRALEILDEEI